MKFQGTQAIKEMKKTHNIGIMSYEKMKKRNIAIARGEYTPMHGDPKVFFPSADSIQAMKEACRQNLLSFDTIDELMADLTGDD